MKVKCIYHRDQYITNFCGSKNCLMPLCPSCIADHTSYHEEDHSRPQYTSIFEAQSEVHAAISASIQCLESDKNRNGKLMVSIEQMPDRIREKIQVAKQMAYEAVENAFENLEKEVLQKLEEMHDKKEIYSVQKTNKMDKKLLVHLDQLYSLQDGLRTERALSNMIYFLREEEQKINSLHSQISTYLHINENYYPTIEINSQAFYSLLPIISRCIKVGTDKKILAESNIKKSKIKHPVETSNARRTSSSKLKENNIALIESQITGHSPSRVYCSPYSKSRGRQDGEYENLSRKIIEMRQENERLSKYLNEQ